MIGALRKEAARWSASSDGVLCSAGSPWGSCPPRPGAGGPVASQSDSATWRAGGSCLWAAFPGPKPAGRRVPHPLPDEGEATGPRRPDHRSRRHDPAGRGAVGAAAHSPQQTRLWSCGQRPVNPRLEVVVAVVAAGLLLVTVAAVRRHRSRRARNWRHLGEILRRAKMKQSPFVSPGGGRGARSDPDVGIGGDRPGETSSRSQPVRPNDREP